MMTPKLKYYCKLWLIGFLLIGLDLAEAGRGGKGYISVPIASKGTRQARTFKDQLKEERELISKLEQIGIEDFFLLNTLNGKKPFHELNGVQIARKLIIIRRSLLTAIEAVAIEDRKIANWLLAAYRNRTLCIGVNNGKPGGLPAGAIIHTDKQSTCGNEPITLFKFPCTNQKLYSPDEITLINILLHEGLHAFQSWLPALQRPATPLQQAIWAIDIHCNEIKASSAELRRLQAILNELDFKTSSRLAIRIVQQLEIDFKGKPAARGQAIADLRRRIKKLQKNARRTKRCREQIKAVLEKFTRKEITLAEANRLLGKLKWYTRFKDTETEFGRLGLFAGGGTVKQEGARQVIIGDTDIVQEDDNGIEVNRFAVGGIDVVTDVFELDSGHILVVGDDDATQLGKIFGYRDTNGDGVIDDSKQILFELRSIYGGGDFAKDPATEQILFYSIASGEVFGFSGGTPGNPFPTTVVGSRGRIEGGGAFYPHLNIFEDGKEIEVSEDIFGTALTLGGENLVSIAPEAGGIFKPAPPYDPFIGDGLIPPAMLAQPTAGFPIITLSGRPLANIGIYQLENNQITLIASKTLDDKGQGNTLIPEPSEGDIIVVRDEGTGLTSEPQTVGSKPSFAIGEVALGDDGFGIEFVGIPGSDVDVQHFVVESWNPLAKIRLDSYGNGFFTMSPTDTAIDHYIRGVSVPTPNGENKCDFAFAKVEVPGNLPCREMGRLGENLFMTSINGTILVSNDDGSTWRSVETGANVGFGPLIVFGDSCALALPAEAGGSAAVSEDGRTWTLHPLKLSGGQPLSTAFSAADTNDEGTLAIATAGQSMFGFSKTNKEIKVTFLKNTLKLLSEVEFNSFDKRWTVAGDEFLINTVKETLSGIGAIRGDDSGAFRDPAWTAVYAEENGARIFGSSAGTYAFAPPVTRIPTELVAQLDNEEVVAITGACDSTIVTLGRKGSLGVSKNGQDFEFADQKLDGEFRNAYYDRMSKRLFAIGTKVFVAKTQ